MSAETMVRLDGGSFVMGSDRFYPEEAPRHRMTVAPFAIDRAPVTNRDFAAFVAETGHVTLAELAPDPDDYPGILPEMIYAGSLVFTPPAGEVGLNDWSAWWRFERGADWRHPLGAGSDLSGLEGHPVVHIACADAEAYAAWAGKRLPSEAEWEFAARGGADGDYAWGDELAPGGRMLANYWQGRFPHENLLTDGYARTSPVGAFPANGFGLVDMIGNVWEWTSDWWTGTHAAARPCCGPERERASADPDAGIARRVIKGGSHLCAENYCRRYRPAARHAQTIDSSTTHIGFRCAMDA